MFGPFRMDIAGQRLWHERRAISLRPKSWDVLHYLVERPGLLVTKADLHREVWQDAAVVEDTLTQSIGELRRVLGDDASKPRFIETVHRRGFRFIANVCEQAPQPVPISVTSPHPWRRRSTLGHRLPVRSVLTSSGVRRSWTSSTSISAGRARVCAS